MARVAFSDGQEIIEQDLNNLQALRERQLFDQIIHSMCQKNAVGFFQDAYFTDYQSNTSISVRAGVGFQLDNTQVDPEPVHRMLWQPTATVLNLATPDPTNPRIDIVVAQASQVTTESAMRNVKDALTGDIALTEVVIETDWTAVPQVITGTPGASPVAPSVPSGYVLIAEILVVAVSGLAGQGGITDERVIIPVAEETYIDTSEFPAVVTQSTTARLKDVLEELANFEFSHETAAEISAGNGGHGVATGTNVQSQLDQLDLLLTYILDVTSGVHGAFLIAYKYGNVANWNATLPVNVAAALDQLASRLRAAEAGTNIGPYVGQSLFDYILPADSPNGAGNTGLTSNNNTNPRGISLADGKLLFGEERIYIRDIKATGKYDANGLQEWAVTSPRQDVRIRLYGSWTWQVNKNYIACSYTPGDYILATGVFDAMSLLGVDNGSGANNCEVWVDGVDTGTQISFRNLQVTLPWGLVGSKQFFNGSMQGLTQGLHTIKIVNAATDSNAQLQLSGITFINTNAIELASNCFINKTQTSFAQQSPTLLGANANGGRATRWFDTVTNLRQEVVSNGYTFSSSVSGSLSSGATSFTVASATGLAANNLLLIQDGPGNSEIVLANSVNTGTGLIDIVAPGLRNNYTNPTVSFYGRVMAGTNHSNEKQDRRRHWSTMGTSSNAGVAVPSMSSQIGIQNVDGQMEDGGTRLAGQSTNINASWQGTNVSPGLYFQMQGNESVVTYEFFGTGLDVLLDSGTNSPYAGAMYIYVDGVLVQDPYDVPADSQFWLKVCSDLPLGHHIVQFCNNGTIYGTSYYHFLYFQEYSPIDSVITGRALNTRNIPASYVWNNNPSNATDPTSTNVIFGISKGVVRHSPYADGLFQGSGWSLAPDIPGYTGGNLFSSSTTADTITKSFFGTGFDFVFQTSSAYGIVQVEIDGMAANSSNFPSGVFQGLGYASGTGKVDTYNASVLQANVSFANISSVPKWHTIVITITGTKNGSSSGYALSMACFDIHGASQSVDASVGRFPMNSYILGGVKDLRTMSYDGVDVLGQYQGFMAETLTLQYGIGNGDVIVPDGVCGDLYLTDDSMVDVEFGVWFYNTNAGHSGSYHMIDGIVDPSGDYTDNYVPSINQMNHQNNKRYFLKKGWHHFAGYAYRDGTAPGYAENRRFGVSVVPPMKYR